MRRISFIYTTIILALLNINLAIADQYILLYQNLFINEGDKAVNKFQLYLPIPPEREHQKISNQTHYPQPSDYLTDKYGQKIAYFEFNNILPGQTFGMYWIGDISTSYKEYDIDPNKVSGLETIPQDIIDVYTRNEEMYSLQSDIIQHAAEEASAGATNTYWMAKNILNFVNANLTHGGSGGWDNAETVYINKEGTCSEFTYLFIALCRANGLPARYVGGTMKRENMIDTSFHRWAEVYLPPYGWVPFDAQTNKFARSRNDAFIVSFSGGNSDYLGWADIEQIKKHNMLYD